MNFSGEVCSNSIMLEETRLSYLLYHLKFSPNLSQNIHFREILRGINYRQISIPGIHLVRELFPHVLNKASPFGYSLDYILSLELLYRQLSAGG